ncbi:MAG TPA: RNB domain-containing ribonuclease [Thermodesulfovibrionales bacterium]|nr:RNB domain-containing ribonuclease [Thermodesulfovibrionales bacterium]
MMTSNVRKHRDILRKIARKAMILRGLLPDYSPAALSELERIQPAPFGAEGSVRDLRHFPWCSIDNDDSRDLDQLTVSESISTGKTKIYVAIADVDAIVKRDTAIDDHARHNTTSIYTVAEVFPMLPEKLSTDLTSLNYAVDRLAIVVEMVIGTDGSLQDSHIYRAIVHNHAKLAYNRVAEWLESQGDVPEDVRSVQGLEDNLLIQDKVAQTMKTFRHIHGALTLETIESRPVFEDDNLMELEKEKKNRARDIIEDFMIAANGMTARYLNAKMFPSLRRVVHIPKRWDRIVEIASEVQFRLPAAPDSKMLEQFLVERKRVDPVGFPDLSLSIIKLLGPGEYVAEFAGQTDEGHFGLAVKDYTHSTAPNRRYPDLITQRLLKAALAGGPVPYDNNELTALAAHCTAEEDAVKKVERQVEKSAAAMLLESRIGEQFDGIITGAASKGTWVRLFHPPIEGKLIRGFEGADVGHRIRVQLVHTDIERGFIDFKRVR